MLNVEWIVDALFNDTVNTEEFYGHVSIKASLGELPIFGATKQSKYSEEEKNFIKRKLLEDIHEFASVDKEIFDKSYNSYIKNPHIQFLSKYPQELLRQNPKYSFSVSQLFS